MTDHLLNDLANLAGRRGRPVDETVRQYVLEGVLRRLSRRAQPEDFVLRGGMLTRLWAEPLARPSQDLDFVGTFPFSVEETARRFLPVVQDAAPDDGLVFSPASFRARGMWLDSEFPGVRLFVRCGLGRPHQTLHIDIGFGDPLVPPAERIAYPGMLSHAPFSLWAVRPETAIGWKLHGLAEKGPLLWRPKDLHDLYLLTTRTTYPLPALTEAIRVAFTSRHYSPLDAPAVFTHPTWWTEHAVIDRWQTFRNQSQGQPIATDLTHVVSTVHQHLKPALHQLTQSIVR